MNGFLIAAAVLSLIVCGLHVWAGGPAIAGPLLRSGDLGRVAKYTNYYCWHIVTIVLAAMPVGFLMGAVRPESRDLAALMTVFAGAFMLWSLGLVVWKRQKPFHLPQWALFLPVAAAGALGLLWP